METSFRVALEDVRLPPNVPAGMNVLVLCSLAYRMRATNDDPPAVVVAREGSGWRLVDGRHRVVAALIAGRRDVLARVERVPS